MWEKRACVGLLTRALPCWEHGGRGGLPGKDPVTDFRQAHAKNTYSGGTVRDSHPVILFSIPGFSPEIPRRPYPVVGAILPPPAADVNPYRKLGFIVPKPSPGGRWIFRFAPWKGKTEKTDEGQPLPHFITYTVKSVQEFPSSVKNQRFLTASPRGSL